MALVVLCACGARASVPDMRWPAELGLPVAASRDLRIVHNDGFIIGYDRAAQRAAWVAYAVTPIADYRTMPRPDFAPDPRLARPARTAVYAGPAFDRGHLAPNYAIAQLYGTTAQRQSFYYSNIVPQRPRLNQLLWQRLEAIEIDDIAPRAGRLWVLAGPVPSADGGPPAAFYRVWLARAAPDNGPSNNPGDRWHALAFLLPQRVRGDERLDRFIVALDRIESLTGLDFLAALPAAAQQRLEANAAPAWRFRFAEFACRPARYDSRWADRDGIELRYDRCREPLSRARLEGPEGGNR